VTELRATSAEDLPGLAQLFAERFGHRLAAEEWEWKYRRLPGETRSVVALDRAGEVVAHAGALGLPARWPGGQGTIWQLCDFVGAPRRGLAPPLVELGRWLLAELPGPDDAPWIFGFPSERHFRLGERCFGYRPLARVQEWSGDIAPAAAVGEAAAEPALETSDHCGEWAEAVWEASRVWGVRRSAAFLNWRYHARPGRYYRFYRLGRGGGQGLAVFAFVGAEARAAELWLPPGRGLAWALPALARDLLASGLATWRFWPPPAGLDLGFASLGLAPAGVVFVGCRGRSGAPDPRPAAAPFYYAMGDWDLT
jgi:hypothetical protein